LSAAPSSSLARLVFRLRLEEVVALVFLLPTTYLTVAASIYAREAGVIGARHSGGLLRLAIAVLALAVLAFALWIRPASAVVRRLRDVLPFVVCILIYTNLHDTIGFVNPNDVHHYLVALDKMIFGQVPCVWAERFITPGRTEVMQFFYLQFFWIAPSTALLLLLRERWAAFRHVTMGVLVCFYLGYALYVVFPAAPPRIVLIPEFKKNLYGYPLFFSNLSAHALSLLPVDSRAAFPSLHAGVSLVSLLYAWRYLRRWFWILLPFAVGLWVSTIYLRHHYVVDLLAGWLLAPVAMWLAPCLDGWWATRQRELGYATARGAPQDRTRAMAGVAFGTRPGASGLK
jgi:membrane-associated phospholipid phosphatase